VSVELVPELSILRHWDWVPRWPF